MATPGLIIFDCDGVLIDSEALACTALVEVLQDYGVSLTLEEVLRNYTGLSEISIIKDIEAKYKIKLLPDFAGKKRELQKKLFEAGLLPTPGIFHLLDDIDTKKCVASSSSPERLRHSLGLVGLWGPFAPYIFSASQVEHGKPAPDLFLFAAAQMGVAPQDCLVIEDSLAGVQAARAAGMRVFGFIGGAHCTSEHGDLLTDTGAEAVFVRMEQLADALYSLSHNP